MVLVVSPRLDLVFHALAHPARRAIIGKNVGAVNYSGYRIYLDQGL
jgi:hypothetical protein